jgi:3-phosphoshikimate 1-carboxyvinyltransferase
MMRSFGIRVFKSTAKSSFGDTVIEKISYKVKASGRKYLARDYEIEPDMSAAAYFYAMAALTGAEIKVDGVKKPSLQGDIEFLTVLEKMGCEVRTPHQDTMQKASVREEDLKGAFSEKTQSVPEPTRAEQIINDIFSAPEEEACEIIVKGPAGGRLKGNITVDMSAFSDQALTLAAIAPFADGPVKITGISHIRVQECDRINAITENLARLGIRTETEEDDSIIIYPGEMHGAEIETYDDHRVAMAFALCGLRTEGVKILNPECCRKTFKEYFEVLSDIIAQINNPLN